MADDDFEAKHRKELTGAIGDVVAANFGEEYRGAVKVERARMDGGDRSTLPSFEARKLPPLPAPAPRADGFVRAADSDWWPVNPKGPGLRGTGCGMPHGGDSHSRGVDDLFGKFPVAEDAE